MLHRKLILQSAVLLLAAILSTALYAADPADLIKYRHSVMKAIGGHMGAITAIVRGKVDYRNHLMFHATGINAASKGVRDIFPPESAKGDTAAKAEVWNNPDQFKQAVMKLEQAANDFLQAADSGDQGQIGTALKELGGSCKNCHDNFRQKKE